MFYIFRATHKPEMQGLGTVPTGMFSSETVNHDNMSQFSYDVGAINVKPPSAAVGFDIRNPYGRTGPTALTSTDEDSSFFATTYPIKITPTSDGTHLHLAKGDLCYSYKTDQDMKTGNDIFHVVPIWRLNKGAQQRAAALTIRKEYNPIKRKPVDYGSGAQGPPSNYMTSDATRILNTFPLTTTEFKENYRFAGVLSQIVSGTHPDFLFKAGYDTNMESIFKLCSMDIYSSTEIPCLVNENVLNSQVIWEIAYNTKHVYRSAIDKYGRPIATNLELPSFYVHYATTSDNARPSEFENICKVPQVVEIQSSNVDPVFGGTLPFSLPPMQVQMEVMEVTHIRPLGKITQAPDSIPSQEEIDSALIDSTQYKRLLESSPLRVHLFSEGWGPFNMFC